MFKLRPYQNQMKSEIYQAWDQGHSNVMLVLPTGMGKTVTFCSVAIDKAISPKNKMVTAILVHRKELVQQISLTLAQQKIVHNIIAPRKTVLEIIGAQRRVHNKQFYDHLSVISVISVDTLNARAVKHEKWAKSVKLWICDEAAHLLIKNKWGRAIKYFPNAIGLGVTATPERLDKKGLGRHADGAFDTMIEGPDVAWAIENDYLSRYKIAVPQSDYQNYLKEAKGNSDYTKQAMTDAARKSHIVGDVVENYKKFANGKQAILFAPSISVAQEMEGRFNDGGIEAKLLTGNSTDVERLNGMLEFKDKKVKVLLNVDLFDEGLDVPGIECVIMARPTMSMGKYRQMIGRGLRIAKGKDFCMIIDHVGNVSRHGMPDKPHHWTLDRIVKRKKNISLIKICSNPLCASPYERFLPECPWCGTPAAKGNGGGERVPPEQVDGDLILIDPYTLNELEKSTVLESPESVGERVGKVAGKPAGIRAMRNQEERLRTQEDLKEAVALWAGYKRHEGMSDREIHKLFYIDHGKTISQALAEPRAQMVKTIIALQKPNNTIQSKVTSKGERWDSY